MHFPHYAGGGGCHECLLIRHDSITQTVKTLVTHVLRFQSPHMLRIPTVKSICPATTQSSMRQKQTFFDWAWHISGPTGRCHEPILHRGITSYLAPPGKSLFHLSLSWNSSSGRRRPRSIMSSDCPFEEEALPANSWHLTYTEKTRHCTIKTSFNRRVLVIDDRGGYKELSSDFSN